MTDHEPNKHRALLVDDDPAVRKDYAKLLRSLGFITETAADGKEAAERLSGSSFDVIVSDLSMPKMGGLEFLRTVRQHDLDVPVVLMTGEPGVESAAEAVEHGAFRYLTKPVDPGRLADIMRSAVSMHEMAKLKREALALVGSEGRQLGDRASLDVRFKSALEQLWMAYQPIVHWPDRAVFGYEALVRSNEPTLVSPLDLLDAAERLGRLHELGRRIRERVAQAAADAPVHGRIHARKIRLVCRLTPAMLFAVGRFRIRAQACDTTVGGILSAYLPLRVGQV
jgi:CheY-like chemotaxis protein